MIVCRKKSAKQGSSRKRNQKVVSVEKTRRKKARAERLAANSGGKSKKELTKAADKLLTKKTAKKVDPNYKPQKASGLTNKERRQIRRQGSKLVRHLQKGIDKPASVYKPKEV